MLDRPTVEPDSAYLGRPAESHIITVVHIFTVNKKDNESAVLRTY